MRYKMMCVLFIMIALALPTMAQDDAPPPPELDGDIILEGLTGPQGLYIDEDGNLWVVDSGVGGDEEVTSIDPSTMTATLAQFGFSGQLIKVSPDGTQEVVALLPSVAIPEDVIGPARAVLLDGTVYVTVGAWQVSAGEAVTTPMQADVVRIEDGEPVTVASLWAHELANNPDGTGNLESHPYGIAAGPDGLLYVADAAANAVISVDPATGETATVAVFEGLPGIFPSPFRNNELVTDPVPTSVVLGEDGTLFVSLLSGAPFVPGSAKVVQVVDGEVSDFATGLTMLTDLEMGPDGNLYATSFGMFTEEGPVPNSGAIIRILPDGTSEVVVAGLPFAGAVAVDADGNGYVTLNALPIPGAGMVVYYEGLTSMEGQPAEG